MKKKHILISLVLIALLIVLFFQIKQILLTQNNRIESNQSYECEYCGAEFYEGDGFHEDRYRTKLCSRSCFSGYFNNHGFVP